MQIVDYLGAMLQGRADLQVTLYHVDESHQASRKAMEGSQNEIGQITAIVEQRWQSRFWDTAMTHLQESGFPGNRIEKVTVPRRGKISKMILDQVEAGGYDTVVMGRRGSGNAFFFGSVSHYVMERLTDSAFWLV